MNFNISNYDEINQIDERNLDSMIDHAVRAILNNIPYTFEEVLQMVCDQLVLSATKMVIELTKKAYNRYINWKNSR